MKREIKKSSTDVKLTNIDYLNDKNIDLIYSKGEEKLYYDKNSDLLIAGDIFKFKELEKYIEQNQFKIKEEEKKIIYEKIKDHKKLKMINQQIIEEELLDSNEEFCIEHENDFNIYEKIIRKSNFL